MLTQQLVIYSVLGNVSNGLLTTYDLVALSLALPSVSVAMQYQSRMYMTVHVSYHIPPHGT